MQKKFKDTMAAPRICEYISYLISKELTIITFFAQCICHIEVGVFFRQGGGEYVFPKCGWVGMCVGV